MNESCPNNCVDGWIKNPYTHTVTICPFCRDKREKESLGGQLNEELNLPPNYTVGRFIPTTIFPMSVKEEIEPMSYQGILADTEALIKTLVSGEKPNESKMFYLGRGALIDNFVYPIVMKAYTGGLTVTPVLDENLLLRMRESEDFSPERKYNAYHLQNYIERDLSVVVLTAGATSNNIHQVLGYMQMRARYDNPTIIVSPTLSAVLVDLLSYQTKDYLQSDWDEMRTEAPDTMTNDEVYAQMTIERETIHRYDLARLHAVHMKIETDLPSVNKERYYQRAKMPTVRRPQR